MASKLVAGKIAFVTGAGNGIGRATCQVLAREGARVIAADRNGTTAKETVTLLINNDHVALTVDVSQAESVHAALKDSMKHYSEPPSIVVNCAGITRDNFILKTDEKNFQDVIDVNLKGTFLVLQAAAKAMVDAGTIDGSIINVASIVGKHGNIGQSNYCASKAGVEALTKTAAKEFGKFGIRCNAVVPGFIDSTMTDTIPEKVKAMFLAHIAAGRLGKPEVFTENPGCILRPVCIGRLRTTSLEQFVTRLKCYERSMFSLLRWTLLWMMQKGECSRHGIAAVLFCYNFYFMLSHHTVYRGSSFRYERLLGCNTTAGSQFEYGLLSLLFLYSLHGSERFQLGCSLNELGLLNDVHMRKDEIEEQRVEVACIQMKHRDRQSEVRLRKDTVV